MSLTLVDLRTRAQIAARNAMGSSYSTAQIDEALDRLFSQFLRVTRCVKLDVTVDVDTATNTADFSDLGGFLAGRIETARVDVDTNYTHVRDDLDIKDKSEVQDKLSCNSSTGTPCMMGFTDSVTATFYPAAKYDGTLSVLYCPLQIPWTLGTRGAYSSSANYLAMDIVSSGGTLYQAISTNTNVAVATTATWNNLGAGTLIAPENIVSVIPDGLVGELVSNGVAAFLQSLDPKQKNAVAGRMAEYQRFEDSCRAIGSISGKSSQRLMRY